MNRLVEARADSDARQIVVRGLLLYIRMGVFVGRCKAIANFEKHGVSFEEISE